jgi:hypothetical protein
MQSYKSIKTPPSDNPQTPDAKKEEKFHLRASEWKPNELHNEK